ncbi:hypothetical protein AtEden1_Chr2g0269361 [Arabidopsis thaliana]
MPNTRLCGSSSEEKISDGRDPKIWDCDSTLYDSYELVSFVHIIERKLMPFSPLARQPGLTLRALMDKDSDHCSCASTKRGPCIHRRKYWWNGKKKDEMKERINKKKMFDFSFSWNFCCKNLFF